MRFACSGRFLCFLFLLVFHQTAHAGVFTDLGLYGGQVYSIAVAPDNPGHLFAGIYLGDGLYFSDDGGVSFQPVRTGSVLGAEGEFKSHAIYDVKIAPSQGLTVWATNQYTLEKSSDGGLSWIHITNKTMQADCVNSSGDIWRMPKSIAIHPTDPDIIYVGTEKPYGNSSAGGAVYKTTDGGESWTKLNGGIDLDIHVSGLALDPQNPDRVWVTTASATNGYGTGSLYLSINGGVSFERINGGRTVGAYYGVSVKPDNSQIVLTGCDYGLFKHSFDGDQWTISQVLPEAIFASAPVFDSRNPDRVYVAWKRPSYFGGDDLPKFSFSTDGGDQWETVTIDIAIADKLSAITLDPTNPDIIYAGDLTMGCLVSRDRGQSFSSSTTGIFGVITYDLAVEPGNTRHMIAGTSSGLFERKTDDIWTRLVPGIARSVCFDPLDSQIFYAGISGTGDRLHRTVDGGATWTQSNDLTGSIRSIAVDPMDTNTLYLTAGQQVRKSVDGGKTFGTVLTGLNLAEQNYSMNVVTIDPTNTDHLYAGGGNFYVPRIYGDLWESHDKGVNWTRTGLVNTIVNDLLIHPDQPDILYAGCGYSANYQDPVLKSTDGGDTWQVMEQGLPNKTTRLLSIWAADPDQTFAVGWDGLIVHTSGNQVHTMDSGDAHDLYGISGLSAQDLFAVGGSGTILHYNGNLWSHQTCPSANNLIDVWMNASDDAFAVGANGTLLHYDGTDWTAMTSPTTLHLEGVFGFSSDDVYAVGWKGTLLHYDGSQWSAMASPLPADTSVNLLDIWGSDPSHIYAVGTGGTILFYNGNTNHLWTLMDSPTTNFLVGVWGVDAESVFVADAYGGLLKRETDSWQSVETDRAMAFTEISGFSQNGIVLSDKDGGLFRRKGNTWETLREPGSSGRSVVGLAFHRENPNILYAATYSTGLFISPNAAQNWLHLGTPEYNVFTIAAGSLYAGTQGKLVQCTGTGVVAGQVSDAQSGALLTGAQVESDLGGLALSVNGDYMMVTASGICDLTASENLHLETGVSGITVYGGNVSWADITMIPRIIEVSPPDNGYGSPTGAVGVQIHDPNGLDLTGPDAVRFLIHDGTANYERNLTDGSVRVIKLNPDEDYSHVTDFWLVYDRNADEPSSYAIGATVAVEVELGGLSHGAWSFTVSDDPVSGELPVTEPLPADDPLISSGIHNAGIRISDGAGSGAAILYDNSFSPAPWFGSTTEFNGIPLENGVGTPLNLQPTGTFFDPPVMVMVPCPGYLDVSDIVLYVFKNGAWQAACDTLGNVLPAGVGFIKARSRVNHNNGSPSRIEIQVYHFTGIQGATGHLPPIPVTGPRDDDLTEPAGDSGSFCFIGTLNHHGPMNSLALGFIILAGICLVGVCLIRFTKPFALFFLICFLFIGPSEAATLFQQVGIASSPHVVGSGARATAMGGAFIAIADDATAASWNPSGLIQLEKPELSLVGDACYRTWDYHSQPHPEIASKESTGNENINYLSATVPIHAWKNMVFSLNYQRLYDFKRDLNYVYDYNASGLDLIQTKAFTQTGSLGALGLAGAMEITPRLSVGLSLNLWTDQLGWTNGWSASYKETGVGTQGGVPVTLENRISETYDNIRGINANLGFLWETSPNLTLGAVIKTPFDADGRHTFQSLSTSSLSPESRMDLSETVTIHMPLSYGLGLACQHSDSFTAALDIYRTHWSDYLITDESGNRFNPIDGQPESQSRVSDTVQIRTGAEYLMLFPEKNLIVPFRAGFFYDPEPAHDSIRKFYGLSMGTGLTCNRFSFDIAYQYRWTLDVDTGNLIATSTADVSQHTLMSSLIIYF